MEIKVRILVILILVNFSGTSNTYSNESGDFSNAPLGLRPGTEAPAGSVGSRLATEAPSGSEGSGPDEKSSEQRNPVLRGVIKDATDGETLIGESVAIIESMADSLEVQVMAMSTGEDYAWFINDAIFNYMPNMFFSPPKANVQGNLSNGAFGFFLASSVHFSEKRTLYP